MQITVTAEHIKNGIRRDACNCPIALAIKEKFYDTHVTPDLIQIKKEKGNHWTNYKPTQKMMIFISHFDNRLTVLPTIFEIHKIKDTANANF